MSRKTVNIWIFAIGVIMLLVRPYLVYQLSGYSQAGKTPVKASLLQRLIKKKDDHFEWHDKATLAVQGRGYSFKMPVKRLPGFDFRKLLQSPVSRLTTFATITAKMLLISPVSHRYSLLSCFRI
ncbi:hypothetical protein [Mucilaginibacter sp.]|uniref:hypothetical protein n=1 Tax=Mucilaginibacter sp. TaxID=1882438 RepID=UPI002ED50033